MARNSLTFYTPDKEAYYTLKKSKLKGTILYDGYHGYKLRDVFVSDDELELSPECMVTWK